ncbi:MAG: peptidoglycan bridge formation glycyltransferase FemA/FemB family protein [Candidatus Doudnabacteria bacterium]
MRIVEINQKEKLNNFIVQHGDSNFLQSWEWGELQKSLGRDIWRVGIEEAGKLVFSALIIKNRLSLGRSYLYCPRGPVFSNFQFSIFNFQTKIWPILFSKIQEIARKEGVIFFRFDYPKLHLPKFLKGKVVQSPKDIQPRSTLILDITRSEEENLAQMKPKTRYNIRLAQRKGVRVRQGAEQADLNIFLSLIKETSRRDRFKIHPEFYYQKMVDFLGKEGVLKIFLAKLQGKVLAANLVLFWGERATYLHGASGNANRNVMAPHLLQWEQIREAKQSGCREYDFWGIMPESGIRREEGGIETNNELSSWVGITRFKKGFGGREVNYAGTYDFVLNHFWYKIYRLFR